MDSMTRSASRVVSGDLQDLQQGQQTRFFGFGLLMEPIRPEFSRLLRSFSDSMDVFRSPDYGLLFMTKTDYADVAMNEETLCIKLGRLHDGQRFISSADLLSRGLSVGHLDPIRAGQGCVTLVVCSKRDPEMLALRRFLASPSVSYWTDGASILVCDNLGLMTEMLASPSLNEAVLPEHFMHRELLGEQTYLSDVDRLLPCQLLRWSPSSYSVQTESTLGDYVSQGSTGSVDDSSVEDYLSALQGVMRLHLRGNEGTYATALSGGIDSSLLVAALNSLPSTGNHSPAYSYAVQTPSFQYEIEYAQDAAEALDAEHHIVNIKPSDFPGLLSESTQLLGMPVRDDARPSHFALLKHVAEYAAETKTVFNGTLTLPDELHWIQGDKYRHIPIWLLRLLGWLAVPFSATKAYGARTAAETLRWKRDLHGEQHYLNSYSLYTDWALVERLFSSEQIDSVFERKRSLLNRYVRTDLMMEAIHLIGMLTTASSQADDMSQMGHWFGAEIVYPYAEDEIIRQVFALNPIERYAFDHQSKPVMRAALASQATIRSNSQPKGWSGPGEDLMEWMRTGPLRDLARSIERPGFVSRQDFQKKLEDPDWFTWSMLTLDLFKKYVLSPAARRARRN